MSSITLQFQPADALMGGAILGVATVGKLLLNGRVLGISGSFKGTVTEGDVSPWRFAFLGGLVASGASRPESRVGVRDRVRPAPAPATRVSSAEKIGAKASKHVPMTAA